MLTPFEAGKNAEELGIDKTKEYVLLYPHKIAQDKGYKVGDFVKLYYDDGSSCPFFKKKGAQSAVSLTWHRLAYAPEPMEEVKEEYVPKVGDRVSVEGVVSKVYASDKSFFVEFGDAQTLVATDEERKAVTLLSRKYPRKITRKEIEEIVGGSFEIVD